MNAKTRTEKIINGQGFTAEQYDYLFSLIAAQIEEAILEYAKEQPTMSMFLHKKLVEEAARGAYVDAMKDWELRASEGMKKIQFDLGFRAAREKAAKLGYAHAKVKGAHIHHGFQFCVEQVAEDIRTMEPDNE